MSSSMCSQDDNSVRPEEVISDIREAWGWLGVVPTKLVDSNKFGDIIFNDAEARYWRLCPEELVCSQIADSAHAYSSLRQEAEFSRDWTMEDLVSAAESLYGVQPPGRCFCLKLPGPLGGHYRIENIGTITRSELVRFSGEVAKQIKDLPDGAQIQFRFVE